MATRNSKARHSKPNAAQSSSVSQAKFDAEYAATSKLSRAIEVMRKNALNDQSFMRLEFVNRLESLMDEYDQRIIAIEQRG